MRGFSLSVALAIVLVSAGCNVPEVLPVATLSGGSGGESDGARSIEFTVTLDYAPPEGAEAAVTWTTEDGSALSSEDFVAATGTLTFSATRPLSQRVVIQVRDDAVVEDEETFTVRLSGPVNLTLAGDVATGAIASNDRPRLTVSDALTEEGEGADGTLTFAFALDQAPAAAQPVTVQWRTESGSALEGEDFVAASGAVSFTRGGPLTAEVSITTLGDLIPEPDEQLTLQLTDVSGAALLLQTSASGVIEADESPTLTVAAARGSEGNDGTTALVFRIRVVGSLHQTVTLDWATEDGSAVSPADYVSGSGTLTFLPGGPTTREVVVHAVGDSVVELDETFTLRLSNPVNAELESATAEGTVVNDDFPALQVADASVLEGTSDGNPALAFTVSLDQAPLAGHDVEVGWSTQDGTALAGLDYTAASGTLTFRAGDPLTQVVFVELLQDAAIEPDETLRLNLTSPTHAVLADATAIGTVRADDFPTVSIGDASKVEGNANNTLGFTVQLSQPMPAGYTASVGYATAAGTATAGSDFVQRTGTVTFNASGLATVSITLVGDLTREPDETFQVLLSGPVNTSLADAVGEGTILNDDFAGVRVSDAVMAEGTGVGTRPLRFTVTLDEAPPEGEVGQVDWTTSNVTAQAGTDYVAASGTLTFTSTDPLTRELVVEVEQDARVEPDETLEIVLSGAVRLTLSDAVGRGTLTADDFPTVSILDLSGDEQNTTWTANFAVTLSEPSPSGYPAQVRCTTEPGTAEAGSDYTHANLVLNFGSTGNVARVCPVTVLGDTVREDDETFTVTLTAVANVTVLDGSAVGTLVADDGPAASLSGRFRLAEGDTGETPLTLAVTLDGPPLPSRPAVFRWEVMDGTARAPSDMPVAAGMLTFIQGQPISQSFTVSVRGDTVPEGDEHFTVVLTPVEYGRVDLGAALVEVLDDDQPQLSISDAAVAEGSSGTTLLQFEVALSEAPASGAAVTVQWSTQDRTAVAGTDYVTGTGTLTFPSGTLLQTVSVEVQGDLSTEPHEEFTVLLSGAVNAQLRDGTGVGTVLDDDGVVIRVDATATGTEDGMTWASAYRTVQAGADRAQALGGGQVWVAAGTYSTGGTVLTLRPNVTVAGGFQGFAAGSGVQETAWGQRDPRQYLTRLDGAGVARHVVVGAASSVLDGFTVSGGFAADPSVAANRRGAGMTLVGDSALVVRTRFERNHALDDGGALFASRVGFEPPPAQFVRDCEFVANQAESGGALYQGDVKLRISDSWFFSNRVTGFGADGGAVTVERGQTWVTDSTFLANDAEGSGGGMMNIFGAVELTRVRLLRNHTGSSGAGLYDYTGARIYRSEFIGNDADSQGGGIYVRGADTLVVDTLFEANEASDGGGVKLWNGTGNQTRFERVRILRNRASRGGGVYQVQGDAYYTDTVIEGNVATRGGGFASLGGDPLLVNVTFANNAAAQGTDFYLLHYESSPADPAKPVVRNSVVLNRSGLASVAYDAKCFGCTFTLTDTFSSDRDGDPQLSRVPLRVSYANGAAAGQPVAVALPGAFAVGDVVEVDDDGVPRTVTAVGAFAITFAPALSRTLLGRVRVDNWGSAPASLDVDLSPAPLSPVIDSGNNAWVLADVGDADGDGDLAEPSPWDLAGKPRFVDDPSVTDQGVGAIPRVDRGALERQVP